MRRSSRSSPWASRASARPRSASRLRSWNSSKITQATPVSAGSPRIIRVNTPSVTTSMRVAAETFDCIRTRKPTVWPTGSPSVAAIRSAAARAARRRGSRTMILPPSTQGSASSSRGTTVVLPAPGGATSTAAHPDKSAAFSRGSASWIGSIGVFYRYRRPGVSPGAAVPSARPRGLRRRCRGPAWTCGCRRGNRSRSRRPDRSGRSSGSYGSTSGSSAGSRT